MDRFCLIFSESATPGPTFYGRSPHLFVVVVVAAAAAVVVVVAASSPGTALRDYDPLGACGTLGIARICCKVGASINEVIRKWETHW